MDTLKKARAKGWNIDDSQEFKLYTTSEKKGCLGETNGHTINHACGFFREFWDTHLHEGFHHKALDQKHYRTVY